MNIAIFTNNYLPNVYGVTASVESFRREFEKRGHTVYIFAPFWPDYADENSRVFRYPALDIKFKFRFPLPIPYSCKMDRLIKKLDIDIIHSQHPNLLGTAAKKWAKKKNIPLVFTWHTLYDHYAHFAKIIPKKWAANYIIKKAVRYANEADVVIAPTDSIIPILKKWGVKNENIIPVATGVDEQDFENADGKNVRKKYGIAEDEIVLLLAARLTEEKNIFFVFNSVKEILKNSEKTKFLVVGGGYLQAEMVKAAQEEGIAEKIFFSGEIPRNEVKNYLAAGNIFVYGSKSETQGMFTMEAMHMGLPIVAVSATGTNSLVLNNGNGFLVNNEQEFSAAVLKLINDKNLRQKFSAVSRKIVQTQFTSAICAEKMLEIYKKLITEKTNPPAVR